MWEWLKSKRAKHECSSSFSLDTVKLLTYNVWFDTMARELRTSALVACLVEESADVMGLQEVTPEVLMLLLGYPALCSMYPYWSTKSVAEVRPYQVLMLSKWRPVDHRSIALPTCMGRKGEMIRFDIGPNSDMAFWCATVHLESLNSQAVRRSQLDILCRELSASAQNPKQPGGRLSVLMGDFNYFGDCEDAEITRNEFKDAWLFLHSDKSPDDGYTYDSHRNPMLSPKYRDRLDRVIWASLPSSGAAHTANWAPTAMRIIGNVPGQYGLPPNLLISDHYGLVAVFQPQVV
eukprot:ANDGO_04193.mRNA.1 endonuclease/exonuclease/phosphatase family protein